MFSSCYDYTSVYEPGQAGRQVICPAKPIKSFWSGCPRTLNLSIYLFICFLSHYFFWPVELRHGKVPLAVSDTCGGNATRGEWRRVPNFKTNLVAVCQRAARPQSEKRPRLRLFSCTAEPASGMQLWSTVLDSPIFPSLMFPPRRWLWTAAGACGGRGSSAPGHAGEGWSSHTGSAPTRCPRMGGSTVRARGCSISPATRSHAATITVRLTDIVLDIYVIFYLQLLCLK